MNDNLTGLEAHLRRVEENADPNWMAWALQAVYIIARPGMQFTSDDVWNLLHTWKPNTSTHEPRAMGPVIREAARRGWIQSTGVYESSKRRSRNSGPVMVWESTNLMAWGKIAQPMIEETA